MILAGASEIDITPPVGTLLAGSLRPRVSIGIDDPLYVKAVVIESGGKKLAYVIFDLIALERRDIEPAIKIVSDKTGIPENSIIWAASHTHTGPYTCRLFSDNDFIDRKWLESVGEKMVQCIIEADSKKKAARFSRLRSFHCGLGHNRRILLKDGRAINTWLLKNVPENLQCIGSAGPIDPEIGIFSLEDADGKIIAVLYHYTLHTNTNFGLKFSADYPGIVALRIKEKFGPQAISLFMPGACGDINTIVSGYRKVGEELAEKIIGAIEQRKPRDEILKLGAKKTEITVERRDFTIDFTERIKNSGWDTESQKIFLKELEIMRKDGKTHDTTVIQAWRIGDTGFVSFPGELFVEWGLIIKKESPFSFTYPVELGGDYIGYLITQQAWEQGGYESLLANSARASVSGVKKMVEKGLILLEELKGQ